MSFSKKSGIVEPEDLSKALSYPTTKVLVSSMSDPATGEAEPVPEGFISGALPFDFETQFVQPGSHLPHTMPEASLFSELARKIGINTNDNIVVYDNKGIYSAARVWWMFKSVGHDNVWVLNGGLPEWLQLGLPVGNSPGELKSSGNFQAQPSKDAFCGWERVLEASKDKSSEIFDGRAAQRFYGLVPEPRKGLRSGHIPNSVSLPFTELLTEGRRLKELSQLQAFFTDLDNEKHCIFSCGSGVTACILALAAYQCGYRSLSVYDGSWSEWGAREDLPVEID